MFEIDDKQILTEIMGTFTRPPLAPPPVIPHQNDNANKRAKTADFRTVGATISHCGNLESWQRNIVNNLAGARGIDQYLVVAPGGGKTLPIICYWTHHLLGLNTLALQNMPAAHALPGMGVNVNPNIAPLFEKNRRVQVPKVLFLVPVIVLAQQTGMEIRKYLSSIMMQIYNNAPNSYIDRYLRTMPGYQINRLANEAANLRTEFDTITAMTNTNRVYNNLDRVQTSLNSVNKSLRDEVEKCIGDLVNEMVYVKTGSSTSDTSFNNALVYVTIYESAPSIVQKINNLQLTIIDEAHLLQESGVENDDNSRATQIMSSLFDILKTIEKTKNNNRLVMLSGTVNPISATRITTYFNECFNRNFPKEIKPASPDAVNRSQLSVIVNDRLNTDDEIVRNILRNVAQNDWGQLYVLFSTARIFRLAEMCIEKLGIKNIENSSPGGYVPTNVFSNLGQDRQNRAGYTLDDSSVDRMSIPSGKQLLVANITNPILRQAVLRGIGFIARNIPNNELEESRGIEMNDTDKLIVAKLFRERKISVLLATDSVGIGVNIDVKDLYIPQVKKYNKNVQNTVNISLRDLSQILNRAGRGATPIASIQTSKPNVEMVMNALYANSSDLPEVGEISRLGISPCDRRSFMNLYRNTGKGLTSAVAKVKSWF